MAILSLPRTEVNCVSDDSSRTETEGRPDDKGLARQGTSGIDSVLLYAFRGVVAQLPRCLRRDQ